MGSISVLAATYTVFILPEDESSALIKAAGKNVLWLDLIAKARESVHSGSLASSTGADGPALAGVLPLVRQSE